MEEKAHRDIGVRDAKSQNRCQDDLSHLDTYRCLEYIVLLEN